MEEHYIGKFNLICGLNCWILLSPFHFLRRNGCPAEFAGDMLAALPQCHDLISFTFRAGAFQIGDHFKHGLKDYTHWSPPIPDSEKWYNAPLDEMAKRGQILSPRP